MRSGPEIFAIDAHCSHYHGPLAEGLVVGDEHPLPLAPRLFRFADRRSNPRAGASPRSRSGKSSTRAIASSFGRKREQPKPRGKGLR